LPLQPSADQIRRREFATIRRGYDPDQVREFLKNVGDQLERLEEQTRAARTDAAKLNAKITELRSAPAPVPPPVVEQPKASDEYGDLAVRMADLLRAAEEHASEINRSAEAEAMTALSSARAEADRIRTDAQGTAESIRGEADNVMRRSQEESERMLSGLHAQRDAAISELEAMRERLLGLVRSLDSWSEMDSSTSPAVQKVTPAPETAGPTVSMPAVGPVAPAPAPQASLPPPAQPAVPVVAPSPDPIMPEAPAGTDVPSEDGLMGDPAFADLWSGTESMDLTIPEISAADLWPDEEGDPTN
jgi:DivIVA domain-containing protein